MKRFRGLAWGLHSSTITAADRIAVFREGGVNEVGTHEELSRRGGYCASLVRRQVRGLVATAA